VKCAILKYLKNQTIREWVTPGLRSKFWYKICNYITRENINFKWYKHFKALNKWLQSYCNNSYCE
jgi:hypothetical protein